MQKVWIYETIIVIGTETTVLFNVHYHFIKALKTTVQIIRVFKCVWSIVSDLTNTCPSKMFFFALYVLVLPWVLWVN